MRPTTTPWVAVFLVPWKLQCRGTFKIQLTMPAAFALGRYALQTGLLSCQGKTPESTMASALYTDVRRKEGTSLFTRWGTDTARLSPGIMSSHRMSSLAVQ